MGYISCQQEHNYAGDKEWHHTRQHLIHTYLAHAAADKKVGGKGRRDHSDFQIEQHNSRKVNRVHAKGCGDWNENWPQ